MYRTAFLLAASAIFLGGACAASAQTAPAGNHYLCFPPHDGEQPMRDVDVDGPIGSGHLEVLQITEICGMVKKTYNKKTYPIDDKYPALVCYLVKPSEFKVRKFAKEDQFGVKESAISQPHELCLPARLKL